MVIRIFKYENWICDMPDDLSLIQEVESRFLVTLESSENLLRQMCRLPRWWVPCKGDRGASAALNSIDVVRGETASQPILEAIRDVFVAKRHIQTVMEAKIDQKINRLLVILFQVKTKNNSPCRSHCDCNTMMQTN